LPSFAADQKPAATRASSGKALNALADAIPWLIGGSADLAESNNTVLEDKPIMERTEPAGRNIYFGVREHAMAAALNGMAAHGGVVPFGGTFLTFSDYARGAIRLAALSELHTILVFTHDSIGLGEDRPTHQPIEHVMALRAIPQLTVMRPADANESVAAWKVAVQHAGGPVALVFSRQAVPVLEGTTGGGAAGLARGAYVVSEADGGTPEALILATGSEVSVAVEAQQLLRDRDVRARVVSMPCWELFEEQDQSYRDEVLPPPVRARVSVEAGITLGWQKWTGDHGINVGIENRFGASAPYQIVMKELGFTAENVAAKVMEAVEKTSGVRA
jgi:transketolase